MNGLKLTPGKKQNSIALGLTPQQISQITGLPQEEVQKLAEELITAEA